MFDRISRPRRFRRPRPYLLLSVVGAIIAGLITAGTVQRAQTTIAGYGTRVSVAVASHDLALGHVIVADDVRWREIPVALASGTPIDDPVGRTVVSPVLEGEPVPAERLAPGGLSPIEALIGPGRRALVVDVADDATTFTQGDRVDLLAAGSMGAGSASWVARDATVVDVGETTVTVAVDERDAPAAASAALDGAVVLALIGED